MENQAKEVYNTPEITLYGSLTEITQMGGGSGVDGITGVDIDGDGNVDIGTGVTNGSL